MDGHDRVISYAKNHGLGLEVPYRTGPVARTYFPDFIVQIDDGRGPEDPLNLVAEVKGYRRQDAVAKAETMKSYWIPGVNNLGVYGRWAFHEFTSAEDIKTEFEDLVSKAVADNLETARAHYRRLNFKELLAASPLDGIDLTRTRELPREIEF